MVLLYRLLIVAISLLFRISLCVLSHGKGMCVYKPLEYANCIDINKWMEYVNIKGEYFKDDLDKLQFYCKSYGCIYEFKETGNYGRVIYGEASCTGGPKKPEGFCYGQPTKEACTGIASLHGPHVMCRWLEHFRDELYFWQFKTREEFEVFQPDWVKEWFALGDEAVMHKKYEMMMRQSFVRYSLDESAKGGHKLELVRLTQMEFNTLINTAREKPKYGDKIKTLADHYGTPADDPMYLEMTDDTFCKFGGKIFLKYGPKEKPESVWSGEATFVTEDKLWLTTAAHVVTNTPWIHDYAYRSYGIHSDDLSKFINFPKIPKINMKTNPELFIVSPHLLKFIDSATMKGKKFKNFHTKENEIGISEILVPLGFFLKDGNKGTKMEFESDETTPLPNFVRNTDIAFVKLNIEGEKKRQIHRVNHKHVVMKAYHKSQYAGVIYDTFSYPARGIEVKDGVYSLWKHQTIITNVYSHILRKAKEKEDMEDKAMREFEHGQSGMCLLIHTVHTGTDDEYECVGVYSGPADLYSIGYHFTRITHITLKTFDKAKK